MLGPSGVLGEETNRIDMSYRWSAEKRTYPFLYENEKTSGEKQGCKTKLSCTLRSSITMSATNWWGSIAAFRTWSCYFSFAGINSAVHVNSIFRFEPRHNLFLLKKSHSKKLSENRICFEIRITFSIKTFSRLVRSLRAVKWLFLPFLIGFYHMLTRNSYF